MDPLEEEAVHQAKPQRTIEHGAQTSEKVQLATDQPQTNECEDTHVTGRCDSRNRSHANQGRNHPRDSDRMEKSRSLIRGQ